MVIQDTRSLSEKNEELLKFRFPFTSRYGDLHGNTVFFMDEEFMPGAQTAHVRSWGTVPFNIC